MEVRTLSAGLNKTHNKYEEAAEMQTIQITIACRKETGRERERGCNLFPTILIKTNVSKYFNNSVVKIKTHNKYECQHRHQKEKEKRKENKYICTRPPPPQKKKIIKRTKV